MPHTHAPAIEAGTCDMHFAPSLFGLGTWGESGSHEAAASKKQTDELSRKLITPRGSCTYTLSIGTMDDLYGAMGEWWLVALGVSSIGAERGEAVHACFSTRRV